MFLCHASFSNCAGAALEKPANRRRRGGRNRNKAGLPNEATSPDGAGLPDGAAAEATDAAEAGVIDSMAQLQIQRLASNGTAGWCRLITWIISMSMCSDFSILPLPWSPPIWSLY